MKKIIGAMIAVAALTGCEDAKPVVDNEYGMRICYNLTINETNKYKEKRDDYSVLSDYARDVIKRQCEYGGKKKEQKIMHDVRYNLKDFNMKDEELFNKGITQDERDVILFASKMAENIGYDLYNMPKYEVKNIAMGNARK